MQLYTAGLGVYCNIRFISFRVHDFEKRVLSVFSGREAEVVLCKSFLQWNALFIKYDTTSLDRPSVGEFCPVVLLEAGYDVYQYSLSKLEGISVPVCSKGR